MPNSFFKTILVVILCLPLLLQAECKQQTVKFISSLPLTGSTNAQMTTVVNSIKMAVDEANVGCKPYFIKYESWDDASPQRGTWDPAVGARPGTPPTLPSAGRPCRRWSALLHRPGSAGASRP